MQWVYRMPMKIKYLYSPFLKKISLPFNPIHSFCSFLLCKQLIKTLPSLQFSSPSLVALILQAPLNIFHILLKRCCVAVLLLPFPSFSSYDSCCPPAVSCQCSLRNLSNNKLYFTAGESPSVLSTLRLSTKGNNKIFKTLQGKEISFNYFAKEGNSGSGLGKNTT